MDLRDIERKIDKIESKVNKLDEKCQQQELVSNSFTHEIRSLKQEFLNLKGEVITIIQDTTEKTWKLINIFSKLIIVLITIIIGFSGIKLVSELPNIFAQIVR